MIEIKNLTKIYKNDGIQTMALDNISFRIEKGEFVSIVGPSGSGKSSLMHILGALDLPTSGEYILNGRNIKNLSDDELSEIRNKEIGFVFQSYNLLPRVSALKNIELPMSYGKVEKKKRTQLALKYLEMVNLKDKTFNLPNQLSGGQKQRVAIARALAMNPSIILADEPTGNLPTNQSEEILEIFKDLNNKGHTIIVITHEPNIAKKANRIITIKDGKLVSDERI